MQEYSRLKSTAPCMRESIKAALGGGAFAATLTLIGFMLYNLKYKSNIGIGRKTSILCMTTLYAVYSQAEVRQFRCMIRQRAGYDYEEEAKYYYEIVSVQDEDEDE